MSSHHSKLSSNNDRQLSNAALVMVPKHRWCLWLFQCFNIAIMATHLSIWMLAIITLALIWQASLIHQFQQQNYFTRNNSKNSQANSPKYKQKSGNKVYSQVLATWHGSKPSEHNNSAHTRALSTKVPAFILAMFAVFGCLAIAINAKQLGVLDSMVHLLSFAYALKALELRYRSDLFQLILLGLFVIASSLIFKQDLAFSLIALLLIIFNLMVLLQYFSYEKNIVTSFKVMALLIAQSLLLAAVLFLIFPRISPFWQIPAASSAKTGLADTLKPGDIAQLTRSNELAFRVEFGDQSIPAYSLLYWRAMVLDHYNGISWSISSPAGSKDSAAKHNSDEMALIANQTNVSALNYRVIAEPSFQKYLFALAPATLNPAQTGIRVSKGYTFQSSSIITQAKSYNLTSYLTVPMGLDLSLEQSTLNLDYPSGSNPRLERLASELKQTIKNPIEIAQAVLEMINQQPFSYTLQPPLLNNNSLDQFFFDTKSGFCAHYASVFTFLMRASGIPARVVTGYLGGEYNGSNDKQGNIKKGHLSIYQYDAHAWAEIWVKDQGWVRIDPTAAVDPQRVNKGWSDQLLREQAELDNNFISLYQMKNIAWLRTLRLQFDLLDYQWTRWVIGFSAKQQLDLFNSWFGDMANWKLAAAIGVSLVMSMGVLWLLLYLLSLAGTRSPKKIAVVWQSLYQKALLNLAKQGIEKPMSMTPKQFAATIKLKSPISAIIFERFTACYNQLCYQPLDDVQREKLYLVMQQEYRALIQSLKAHQ